MNQGHYNSHRSKKFHYYSPIQRRAVIILQFSKKCHYVRYGRGWAHMQTTVFRIAKNASLSSTLSLSLTRGPHRSFSFPIFFYLWRRLLLACVNAHPRWPMCGGGGGGACSPMSPHTCVPAAEAAPARVPSGVGATLGRGHVSCRTTTMPESEHPPLSCHATTRYQYHICQTPLTTSR